MSISKNLARVLRIVKIARGLSYTEFSDELGVPKSSLTGYMNGTGNPRSDTLDMLAEKLGIPITAIVSDPLPGQEQAETIAGAAKLFAALTPEQQAKGMELFLELAAMFAEKS